VRATQARRDNGYNAPLIHNLVKRAIRAGAIAQTT
jgi:hypothetical protein